MSLAVAACGKKQVETPPPVTEQAPPVEAAPGDDVGLIDLPGSQAAMVAVAGTDTIFFGTDMSDIDAEDQAILAAHARWLLANPNVRASIEGHADERGTREYNHALGERRANAAKNYLTSQGVPENRLLVISWGKERPVAPGSNEQAWAQNRRAVTVIVR
jgi:peptidoglycan-associated lipoprotein